MYNKKFHKTKIIGVNIFCRKILFKHVGGFLYEIYFVTEHFHIEII